MSQIGTPAVTARGREVLAGHHEYLGVPGMRKAGKENVRGEPMRLQAAPFFPTM